LQGLRISQRGYFIQKSCDRTAEPDMNYCYKITTVLLQSDCDWNCTTKEPKLISTFLGIFVRFKKLICTLKVLRKFATVHRRPSEATVLSSIGSERCKAVEVWAEIKGRDYRSRSDSYVLRPCCAIKNTATWQS